MNVTLDDITDHSVYIFTTISYSNRVHLAKWGYGGPNHPLCGADPGWRNYDAAYMLDGDDKPRAHPLCPRCVPHFKAMRKAAAAKENDC